QHADGGVMNNPDPATPELVDDFRKGADGLFPPKLLIAGTTHGRLDPAWLDLTASDERLTRYPEAHGHTDPSPQLPPTLSPQRRGEGDRPARFPSPPGVSPACCGWV